MRLRWILASLLASALLISSAYAGGKRYALVIGVKKYLATQPLPELPYTENDAEGLAKVLEAGGYDVTLMTQAVSRIEGNEDFAPTCTYIREQLDAMLTNPNLTEEDIVIVALAGHGVQFELVEGETKTARFYFCPADAHITNIKTANEITARNELLDLRELYEILHTSKAGGKLLLVDACRNDPSKPGVTRSVSSVTLPPLPPPPGGTAAFFSCSAHQKAFEDKDLKHGVFFHHIIEALKGDADVGNAKFPADGVITLSELSGNVSGTTYDFVRKKFHGAKQAPEMKGEFRLTIPLISVAGATVAAKPVSPKPEVPNLATTKTGDLTKPPSKQMEKSTPDRLASAKLIPEKRPLSQSPPVRATAIDLIGTNAGDIRVFQPELGLKLIWCPPGSFQMGDPKSNNSKTKYSAQVTLTRGFWLGQTEVTQTQWLLVMKSSPWLGKSYIKEGRDFPASYISQGIHDNGKIDPDSAGQFCQKLTEQEIKIGRLPAGWKYALPTEAQWEYACRAGTTTKYSFGDDSSNLADYAWYQKTTNSAKEPYPHEVGLKLRNTWGFHDMHGNVMEWCVDVDHSGRLKGGVDPIGLRQDSDGNESYYRVLRGSGWSHNTLSCSSAMRDQFKQLAYVASDTGFRVAVIPTGSTTGK